MQSDSNLLYHGSYQGNIVAILDTGCLLPGKTSTHQVVANGQHGICMTRNYSVAAKWGGVQGITLAFDRDRLRTRHRIVPVNKCHTRRHGPCQQSAKSEGLAEEFVLGPISDFKKYLVAVYLGKYQINHLPQRLLEEYSAYILERKKTVSVEYFT